MNLCKDKNTWDQWNLLGMQEFLQRTANLPFSPVPEKYLVYSAQDVRDLIMERLFTEKAEASVSAALAPPSALPSLRCMNPDAL